MSFHVRRVHESEVMEGIGSDSNASNHLHGGDHHGLYIHKVAAPPKKNLMKEIKDAVRETFFSDNPFGDFKDQPRSRKLVLGLQTVFPILEWGREYSFHKFKGDLVSGITVASLCIPQVSRLHRIVLFHINISLLTLVLVLDRILHMQSLHIWILNMHYVSFPPTNHKNKCI